MTAASPPTTAVARLQTRLSGQGTGRIGSAAGALGSRGTPTSMRGRFAKFGSMYGDETGALSALATTMQARRAFENGTMAATVKKPFSQDDYEASERKRRGLKPRTMLPGGAGAQPVNQKPSPPMQTPIMGTQAPAVPQASPFGATATARATSTPTAPAAKASVGAMNRMMLDPGRFNMTDKYVPKFASKIAVS
jgi:hypothetical protein